ncbi:unnamed protein product [Oikopleura dioica]|uniref:Uncharacterized protein n=1 Tax=Oikopleura dioica TaxID=34765 RepID=E4Z578_OIKDI|nr:unnamed protein product [Oikopleura dioica]
MEDAGERMSQKVEEFDEDPEKEEIAKRMKLMRCLQTNFSASIENGKKGGDPAERCRFNIEDSIELQETQKAKDLGKVVGQMAKSLEDYSSLLARLSDSLIKDEKFRVKGNDEYRDFRRLFQNSIDCAKYLCPELEILAKFVIPLTPDKLGGLNLVSKRDENYNEDFEAFKNPAN